MEVTMNNAEGPEKKSFSLKPIEQRMLQVLIETHQAQLSNFLSMLGVERFAYPINQKTQFNLSLDLKTVEIWDNPDKPDVAPPDVPGAPGGSVANAVKE
jgi:hypothetical protein